MARRFALAFIMLVVIVTFSQWAATQEQKTKQPERIAVSELKKKLDSGEKFLLIDVREDWELKQEGAISGAIHIPMAELDARMNDIPKDVELVFYCRAGGRAEGAAEQFIKAGYRAGKFCGIRDWKKENQKTVDKVDRPGGGPIRPKP